MKLDGLQKKLGHRFADAGLLEEALTHPSHGYEARRRMPDNQRLEFLGDAVLQLAATEHLYRLLPEAREGELTALRARLVSRAQLQTMAEALDLGALLVLGRGEESSGGRARPSNLADAMEAVLGAVFCDAGWEKARDIAVRLLGPALDAAQQAESANPKGELQERLQALGGEAPVYTCVAEEGPAHARRFEVKAEWQGRELGHGWGGSKKEAEIEAARMALQGLDKKTV